MRREAAVALVAAPLGVLEVRRDAADASIEEKQEDEQLAVCVRAMEALKSEPMKVQAMQDRFMAGTASIDR